MEEQKSRSDEHIKKNTEREIVSEREEHESVSTSGTIIEDTTEADEVDGADKKEEADKKEKQNRFQERIEIKTAPEKEKPKEESKSELSKRGLISETFQEKIADEEKKIKEEFSYKDIISWTSKNSKWLIPIVFIAIAIFISTFFRMYPLYLPVTDVIAEENIIGNYKNLIASEVDKNYPNIPAYNRQSIISNELQKFLQKNEKGVQKQIDDLSHELKGYLKDENEDTYLLRIDPHLWYGQARNYLEHGHLGDTIIDGKSVNSLRNGRLGKETTVQLHPYIIAYWYKFLHFFNKNISLMKAMSLLPILIIGLSIIPLFFITRKIAGNLGGLFAGIIFAINLPLLQRTSAGISDTDPYSVFFPLLIGWIFLEACGADTTKKRILFSAVAGLFMGIYALTWAGWWYTFILLAATIGLALLFDIIIDFRRTKKLTHSLIKFRTWKKYATIFLPFLLVSLPTIKLKYSLIKFIIAPLRILRLKELDVGSLWPTVFGTVKELGSADISKLIPLMGGKLIVFLATAGIILTLLKKNKKGERQIIYTIFLALWFLSACYSFTQSVRFSILMVPAFAIAFGIGVCTLMDKITNQTKKKFKINKQHLKVIVVLFISILFIFMAKNAHFDMRSEIPEVNDAWHDVLTKIKQYSDDNAVITSWWDYGHWFTAIAERKVTFDGGDQGERIYWVGKILSTESEPEAIGILRMLNCGQEQAPHVLEKYLNGDTVESIHILNEIVVLDKNGAREHLKNKGLPMEAVKEVLNATHCEDLLPQYFITSGDMVKKAITWGHFGSWDFEKAQVYKTVKNMKKNEAIEYLMQGYNFTIDKAITTYKDIKKTAIDEWAAEKPSYMTQSRECQKKENKLYCPVEVEGDSVNFIVDLEIMDVTLKIDNNEIVHPTSFVYPNENVVEIKRYESQIIPLSFVLFTDGKTYRFIITHPFLAGSMFTKLFYYRGHGLECFELFDRRQEVISQGDILVWKVDWGCNQENNIYA